MRVYLKLSMTLAMIGAVAFMTGCTAVGSVMKADPVLTKSDISKLSANPADSCLLFGGFSGLSFTPKDTFNIVLDTTSGQQTLSPARPSATSSVIPFTFAGVPKGDFAISWILRDAWYGETDWLKKPVMEKLTFGTPPAGEQKSSKMGGHGDIHADLKGKCDGGFIWLGFYTINKGGMLSNSKLERKTSLEYYDKDKYLNSIREQVKGTVWEAAIKK